MKNNTFAILEKAYAKIFDHLCRTDEFGFSDFSDIIVEVKLENGVTIRHSYKDNQKRLRQKEEELGLLNPPK